MDLTADMAPPRLWILQSYFLSVRLEVEKDPVHVRALIEELQNAKKQYNEAIAEWKKRQPEGEIKDLITNKADVIAQNFYTVIDRDFIPAVQAGDHKKVSELNDAVLEQLYKDQTTLLTTAQEKLAAENKTVEDAAASAIGFRTILLVVVCLGILVFVTLLSLVIVRIIGQPLAEVVEKLKQIALGDVNQTLDYQSKDEIGSLADAFRTLTDYLKETGTAVEAIGNGDLERVITPRSDKDLVSNNLKLTNSSIKNVAAETATLTQAVLHGNVNARINTNGFNGSYKDLLSGINELLNAVTTRTQVVSERAEKLRALCITNLGKGIDALSNGDFDFEIISGTEYLNDESPDDLGVLARSVDGIIKQSRLTIEGFEKSRATLRELIAATKELTTEANKGNISFRGGRH